MDGHVDLICAVIWRFSENAVFQMILALSFSINAVVVRSMVWSDRSQSHTDRVDNGRMLLASCHACRDVYKLCAIAEQAHIM